MHRCMACCAVAQVKAPGCAAGGGGDAAAVLLTDANNFSYGIGEDVAGAGALLLAAVTSRSAAPGSRLNK